MGLRATLSKRLSSNRRGALSIFTGIAAGQLLALAAAPVLSRLYSPTDFGVFTTCSAIVLTLGTVAGLRFELAMPLPRRDQDAYGLGILGIIYRDGRGSIGHAQITYDTKHIVEQSES